MGRQIALDRGLVADDEVVKQLVAERDSPLLGRSLESLQWPEEPLRAVLIRTSHFSVLMGGSTHQFEALHTPGGCTPGADPNGPLC